jgi:protein O-mannosyl-transferase
MRTNVKNNTLIALVIFAAVFVSYSGALNSGFVWDDEFLVLTNPLVRAPIWSFQAFKQDIANSCFRFSVYYRPMQITSYALDHMLWGFSAFGYHLTNILLHFVNALLVFLVALRLSRNKLAALVTGLLFAVHPQQVGAVSFISGRADLLFFLFGFLYIIFFLQSNGIQKKGHVVISTLFLFLALFSKETALIYPAAILAAGTMCFGRRIPLKRYIPGFLAVLAYALFRVFVIRAGTSGVFSGEGPMQPGYSYAAVLQKALHQLFFPAGLHFRNTGDLRPDAFILGVSAISAAAILYLLKEKRRVLLAGIFFFLVALVPPALSYAKFGIYAEQWMYLPSFGLFLFVSVSLSDICEKRGYIHKGVVFSLVFFAIALLTSSTRAYNDHWKDTSSLSQKVLASSPQDSVAIYYKAIDTGRSLGISGALGVMRKGQEKENADPLQLYLKGRIALAAGETEEAENDFRKALALKPGYDNAYVGMAFVSLIKGEQEKGAAYLRKALEFNSANREALLFLTRYYLSREKFSEALNSKEKALKIYPYNYEILLLAGDVHYTLGDMPESARYYVKAYRLYPERPEAYYSLGKVFYSSDDPHQAMIWARRAVEKDPSYQPALQLIREIHTDRM